VQPIDRPIVFRQQQPAADHQAARAVRDGVEWSDCCRHMGLHRKSPAGHVPAALMGEENDAYPVVASLNAGWRVIVCKAAIQWILQRRRGGPNGWRGRSYCRTSEALVGCAREHVGGTAGDALVILLRLPDRIGGEA